MSAQRDDGEGRPLVSVIVPSYNQGHFIAETLDSILDQDYRPLEVVVVDGASTDETVDILRAYGEKHPEIHWVSEPDSGVADAVNKGFARASGMYAGIQSSDDVYRPGAIAEAVEVLASNPAVGIVCADAEIIDERGALEALAPYRLPFTPARFLARSTVIHQSSTFFDLALARSVGGWNSRYFCADTDMWLRMVFRTRVVKVDRVWSAWRKHGGQRDTERTKMWEDWGRMIRDSDDVRRAPLRLRLAARAGRRLMAIDYNPTESSWFRARQVWLALATYPPSYRSLYSRELLMPDRVFGLGLRERVRRLLAGRS